MTAVEYILNIVVGQDGEERDVRVKDTLSKSEINQAKEMEKEQTIDFAVKFMMQDRPVVSFYNETFKTI